MLNKETITRVWHGKTSKAMASEYLDILLSSGTTDYLKIAENISVKIWISEEEDITHFCTVTEWPDIEAVKKFAGANYEKAVYYPEDQGKLLEFEEKVSHYRTLTVSRGKVGQYVRQMNELFFGGSWQGESFAEKLSRLKEEDAFMAPGPGIHCVAELVWHCIYWRQVFVARVMGTDEEMEKSYDEMNFLSIEKLRAMGWKNLWNTFQESQKEITSFLEGLSDSTLASMYRRGYTIEFMTEGLIHHEVYHLGQIGLVLKINAGQL